MIRLTNQLFILSYSSSSLIITAGINLSISDSSLSLKRKSILLGHCFFEFGILNKGYSKLLFSTTIVIFMMGLHCCL